MATGRLPFKEDNLQKTMNKVLFSQPPYPDTLSPELKDIIERMLTKPQDQRITLDDIKKHAYFSPREHNLILPFIEKNSSFSFSPQIIHKCEQYGISTQTLRQSLLIKQFNEETAIMRILKRADLIAEMTNYRAPNSLARNRNDSLTKIASPTPPPKQPEPEEPSSLSQHEEIMNESECELVAPKVYHRPQRQRRRAFSTNRLPPLIMN